MDIAGMRVRVSKEAVVIVVLVAPVVLDPTILWVIVVVPRLLAIMFVPASLDPAGVTPMSLPAGFPGVARAPIFHLLVICPRAHHHNTV